MDLLDVHTHLLHDLHAITEGEHDTLLSGTNEMSLVVFVEIQTIDGTADLLILQHTFRAIAKRDHRHAFTANGHTGSQVIHLGIADLRRNITMRAGIQDTRTIDTEQHT